MNFTPAQAVIAAMVTPALLMLASASLIATVLVRVARVVDRIRKLDEARQHLDGDTLDRYERRAIIAERAVTMLFAAVAVVVLDGFAIAIDHLAGGALAALPLALTVIGMALIAGGCGLMLRESQLAATQIRAEIATLRER